MLTSQDSSGIARQDLNGHARIGFERRCDLVVIVIPNFKPFVLALVGGGPFHQRKQPKYPHAARGSPS